MGSYLSILADRLLHLHQKFLSIGLQVVSFPTGEARRELRRVGGAASARVAWDGLIRWVYIEVDCASTRGFDIDAGAGCAGGLCGPEDRCGGRERDGASHHG